MRRLSLVKRTCNSLPWIGEQSTSPRRRGVGCLTMLSLSVINDLVIAVCENENTCSHPMCMGNADGTIRMFPTFLSFPYGPRLRWPLSLGYRCRDAHGLSLCACGRLSRVSYLRGRATAVSSVHSSDQGPRPPGFSTFTDHRSVSSCEDRFIHEVQ